jgi:hypothetical protein
VVVAALRALAFQLLLLLLLLVVVVVVVVVQRWQHRANQP